jgi:hypothetical protein
MEGHVPVIAKIQMVMSNSGKKGYGPVEDEVEKGIKKEEVMLSGRVPLGEVNSPLKGSPHVDATKVDGGGNHPKLRVRARHLADINTELKAQLQHDHLDVMPNREKRNLDQSCLQGEEYRSLLDRFRGEKPNTGNIKCADSKSC